MQLLRSVLFLTNSVSKLLNINYSLQINLLYLSNKNKRRTYI